MKRIVLQRWSVPLALLGVVILAYGVFIPWLGLYGDDWPYLWVHHVSGAGGYINFVAWDRPFSAWIYLLITPLLGESIWAYHLFLALLRWSGAVLLWWVMKLVWPEREQLAAWSAFLFVIYPGFRQQPIPLEFMLHFSTLALFLFSLGMMVRAVQQPARAAFFTALNLLSAASMFGLEYFVGMELLRPVLLWTVLGKILPEPRARLKRTLTLWLPNLLLVAVFAVWRTLIFKFPSYQPTFLKTLLSSPVESLYGLALRIFTDLRAVTFGAWRQVFSLPEQPGLVLIYVLIFAASAGLVFFTARSLKSSQSAMMVQEKWLPMPLLLGLFTLLVAGWPFWLTGLPVSLSFPWDRSTLSFLLGASWLMAGLVEMFQPRFQILILTVLVGLAVGSQMQNAANYRQESEKLRTFFWQLAWRAPQLKPGTILLSEQIPLNYYGDNGLTPPLNWTYAPKSKGEKQVYNFFDLDERIDSALSVLEEGQPVSRTYRSFSFSGNTSGLLMAYYRPDRCLRVLGPQDALLPDLPRRLSETLALSHLDQIKVDSMLPAQPPAHLVGSEPEHNWCYWFESADLARQQGNWAMVIRIWRDTQDLGLEPNDRSELLPFIEGLARGGDVDTARALTSRAVQNTELRPAVCAMWNTLAKDLPGVSAGADLKCKQ